jgi:hypothetical protein
MTYPPQQPGNWQEPTWPSADQQPEQPYAAPYGGAAVPPGYAAPPAYPGSGQPAYPAYGQPAYPGADQPGYPGYGYGAPAPVVRPTNTMAIVALVLSLVGLPCGLTAPVGAIIGHVARRQIRERGESGDGMALAGIIVGWIVTALWLVYVAFMIFLLIMAADSSTSTV